MANTIMPTVFASGVRRLRTLSGWPMLGAMGTPPDQTTIAELVVNGGYDMGTINMLITMGATNEQLQALPYPASANERAAGITNLMNQLGGAQATPGAAATSAGSYPQGAIPVIQTDLFGNLDLSLRSSWDAITSQFAQVGQQLNAIAAQSPNDPAVIQMRGQYNSLAKQFSDAWLRVFGGSAPVSTLGDWQDIAVGSGIVVIGGVLIASGVGIPLVAGIVGIASGLAVVVKWINSRNAQNAVAQTVASTQAQLAQALAAAQAKGDTATANQILKTMAVTGGTAQAPGVSNWGTWFQQNMPLLIGALAAIVIVPPLLRRR